MLESDKPIERGLSGDQKDSYQITLVEGQYAGLAVEQRGIDVVASLIDPDGKLIFEFDAERECTVWKILNWWLSLLAITK